MARDLRDILAELILAEVGTPAKSELVPKDVDRTNSTLVCLPIVPRSTRRLQSIIPISMEGFCAAVRRYAEALPEVIILPEDQNNYEVPRSVFVPKVFRTTSDVRIHLDLTLQLAHSIMAKMDNAITSYTTAYDKDSPMRCGWSNINWGPCGTQRRVNDVKLVTVGMPLWYFTNKDMVDFTAKQEFRNPASLQNEHLKNVLAPTELWARLHDFCSSHDAHHFIVTTYNRWAFGVFSNHWTVAYVTPPMHIDARGPNILQTIMFWSHSSIGHPKAYNVINVPETPNFVEHPLRYRHQAVLQPRAAYCLSCCS